LNTEDLNRRTQYIVSNLFYLIRKIWYFLFNIPINNWNQVANATSFNAMLRSSWRACVYEYPISLNLRTKSIRLLRNELQFTELNKGFMTELVSQKGLEHLNIHLWYVVSSLFWGSLLILFWTEKSVREIIIFLWWLTRIIEAG
jgi:hypothetical protein